MLKKMALRLLIAIILLGAVGYGFTYYRYLAPSANMHEYSEYVVNDTAAPKDGSIKVTSLGTTTLLIDDGQTQLMVDAFITRPGVWQVARAAMSTDKALVDSTLARLNINRLKAVFVSHSHIDHVFDVPYVIEKTNAHLYGSPSTLNIGRGGGLREDQMTAYAVGTPVTVGEFSVTALISKHSPALPGVNDDIGQMIDRPVTQPAKVGEYKEGGSYDLLITHRGRSFLVKSSANQVPGALDNVKAEVVFLGILTLGKHDQAFRDAYYDETIAKIKPKMVVPIHWDNSYLPLNESLQAANKTMDDLKVSLDFIIGRTRSDGITLKLLQGFHSIILFSS